MKKTVLFIALALTLLMLTACSGEPSSFTGVVPELSADGNGRIISGSVQKGNPSEQRILVYLTGGEAEGWQTTPGGGYLFRFESNGNFDITVTNRDAKEAVLYLVPNNVDFSTRETVEKQKLATHPVTLPAPAPTHEPAPPPAAKPAEEPAMAPTPIPTATPVTAASSTAVPTDPPEFTIRYFLNDGTENTLGEVTKKRAGQSAALTKTIPEREGYVFEGWHTDRDETEKKYASGANYSADGDENLYAIWKQAAAGLGGDAYIMLKDDGAPQDVYRDLAFMGSNKNGADGSIGCSPHFKGEKVIGEESMLFSYTPPSNGSSHWAGVAMLFGPQAWDKDPGASGPVLSKFTQMSFHVKGSGGQVKFFIECDGYAQATKFVTLTDEWQQIVLPLKSGWKFCNIPFGWACNESDPARRGGEILFYVDGLRFE